MPKKKKRNPVTFNEHLSAVVAGKREKKGLSVEEVADQSGIGYSTLRRRFDGSGFLVSELEAVATVVGTPAHELVEEALKDFGGIDRLIADAKIRLATASVSDASTTTDDLAEQRRKQQERAASMSSREMAEQDAAAHGLDDELDPNRDDDPTSTS